MKSKKILAFLLILVLMASILSLYSTVSARWTNTTNMSCNLTFSGKTATCTGDIDALTGSTISGTLTLYKKNGSSWDYVTSWNKSAGATLNITEKYTVNSSGTYIVVLTGMVTRNGVSENVALNSNEKTCN